MEGDSAPHSPAASGSAAGPIRTKSRRLQNACDICRQRKIRCDSGTMPNNICSNCIAFGSVCTHTPSRRGKKKAPSSVDSSQPADNTNAIRTVVSDILSTETSYKVPQDVATVRRTLVDLSKHIRELEDTVKTFNADSTLRTRIDEESTPVDSGLTGDRFYGKSSNGMLLNATIDLKKAFNGQGGPPNEHHMRPEFWMPSSQERIKEEKTLLKFPKAETASRLVDFYFMRLDKVAVFPLLHGPGFKQSLSEGLHHRNYHFGALVLCVCALSARFLASGNQAAQMSDEEKCLGWECFSQVYPPRSSFVSPPTLYELQLYCLLAMYLHHTSMPEAAWTIAGVGLRCALDIGAHRRISDQHDPTSENELWKRAFWGLWALDIGMSANFGRPQTIYPEDYDQDLPVECDDNYWPNANANISLAFKQPPGEPSHLCFWIALLRLYEILSTVQRSIYGIRQPFPPEAEVVVKLDALLQSWLESIPVHLQWNPQMENLVFIEQSAQLYAWYYYAQILIHKPFVSGQRKVEDMSLPSLSLCAQAARTCKHIFEVQAQRGSILHPNVHIVVNSVIVLLFNVWSGRRIGLAADPSKDMEVVYKFIELLRPHERSYPEVGRACDFIEELITMGATYLLGSSSAGTGEFPTFGSGSLAAFSGGSASGSSQFMQGAVNWLPDTFHHSGPGPSFSFSSSSTSGSFSEFEGQDDSDFLSLLVRSWSQETAPTHATSSGNMEGVETPIFSDIEGQYSWDDWTQH